MSSQYNEHDHPRTTAGRWAEKPQADPGGDLLADSFEWEPADIYPYPQANDLDKVALAVDIVKAGADTPDALAVALDLSPREGRYYGDCAAWMGFLERGGTDEPDGAVYRLTAAGQEFSLADDTSRAQFIAAIVDQCEDSQDPVDQVVERLCKDGLSRVTARRRAETMASWRRQVDSNNLVFLIGETEHKLAGLFTGAEALANSQRAEARARKAARQVLRGGQCPTCFQTLPLTGLCDNCN